MKISVATSGGGSGGGSHSFSGPPLSISGVGGGIEPYYVESIDVDLNGNTDTITDQCGNSEVRRTGTRGNWNVDTEFYISDTTLPALQTMCESDEPVNIQSPALGDRGGKYVISKCTYTIADDTGVLEMPSLPSHDISFVVKLSAKNPQAAKNSGG